MFDSESKNYIQHCIELARRGLGFVNPNPPVGAILVKDGKIIGEGWHTKSGSPHAEVEALRSCKEDPSGATLYVTLEPCTHVGKTPPCIDAVIKAGISHVFIGTLDPNPIVRGKGVSSLKTAGIQVDIGVEEKECKQLIRIFSHWITAGKPYVVATVAVSSDLKIAAQEGVRTQLTGIESEKITHALRHECDAVLVGVDTVISDNPFLTDRHHTPPRNPLRIILDSTLLAPLDSHVFADADVSVITTDKSTSEKRRAFEEKGIQVIVLPSNNDKIDLKAFLSYCASRGITSILVEGGRRVIDSFIESDLVDEWHIFKSPIVLGEKGLDVCTRLEYIRSLLRAALQNSCGIDTHYQLIAVLSQGRRAAIEE